jgi:uncharacterized protein
MNHATFSQLADDSTVILTTYRRDGNEVDTPLHIALDGDRAFIRTYARAGKMRRIRRNQHVTMWPATTGKKSRVLVLMRPRAAKRAGPGIQAHARVLDGVEAREASNALHRKYLLLQGWLIPLSHRLMRTQTVDIELTPGRHYAPIGDRPRRCGRSSRCTPRRQPDQRARGCETRTWLPEIHRVVRTGRRR